MASDFDVIVAEAVKEEANLPSDTAATVVWEVMEACYARGTKPTASSPSGRDLVQHYNTIRGFYYKNPHDRDCCTKAVLTDYLNKKRKKTVVQRTLFAQSTKPTVSVENEPPKEKNSSTDAPSSLVTPPPGFFEPPETELEKLLHSC